MPTIYQTSPEQQFTKQGPALCLVLLLIMLYAPSQPLLLPWLLWYHNPANPGHNQRKQIICHCGCNQPGNIHRTTYKLLHNLIPHQHHINYQSCNIQRQPEPYPPTILSTGLYTVQVSTQSDISRSEWLGLSARASTWISLSARASSTRISLSASISKESNNILQGCHQPGWWHRHPNDVDPIWEEGQFTSVLGLYKDQPPWEPTARNKDQQESKKHLKRSREKVGTERVHTARLFGKRRSSRLCLTQ